VSSHQVALDAGTCGREYETAFQVRRQLGIPSDVGLILTKDPSGDRCDYSGIALLGNGRPGGWIILKQASSRALTHEIGHNLGLRHNRLIACGSQGRNCSGLVEYGGQSSVMGAADADAEIALANHELWQLGMLGPGRMLSVPADAGSAILLEQHLPLDVTDDRAPTVVGGERVVRAIHLRESASEAWLSHRVMPAINVQRPRGVVIHARTTWSDLVVRTDTGVPIELDVPPNFYSGQRTSDRVAETQNMLQPGSSFTTVGGTTVRVGELVTTPYGPGLRVTWTGSGVGTPQAPWPPRLTITIDRPYGPTPYDVTPGERIPEGPATLALQGLKGAQFAECSIVDQAGRILLTKRADDVVPAAGSTWWGTITGDGRFTGWSPASRQLLQASWRFPFIGGVPADGDSVSIDLTAGNYAWRTLCVTPAGQTLEYGQAMTATVFSANPSPSPTSPSPSPSRTSGSPSPSPTSPSPRPTGTPGTDTTPPYASDGLMALFGFAMGARVDHRFTNARQIKPVLSLSIPGYADADSGVARRLGACTSLPVAESGRCEAPVTPGKGTITAGAVDRAGNAAESSIDYDIQLVKLVRKTNAAWSVNGQGASPKRKGATASITVTGRQFMIIAACGASRGAISVSIGGSRAYPVDIKGIPAAACQPWGAEIPGGKATLRITYTEKSPTINSDFIHAIAVLK
jgi:hypothetical protein